VAKAVTQNIENGNYLLTKINGRPVRGLLDTGSGSTLINSSLARKLKLPIRPVQKGQLSCLFAAEGSKLNIEGVTDITFNVSGLLIMHTVYVVVNIAESLILGSDFLSDNQIIIDYSHKIVSLCSDLVRAPLICNNDRQHVARLSKTICIPSGSEQIANITCSPQFSNCDVLIEGLPLLQFQKFAVARTICKTDKQSNTVARILNCLPQTLVLRKGTRLATVNTVNVQKDCQPFRLPDDQPDDVNIEMEKPSRAQLEEFANEYGFRINSELTSAQRFELLCVLYKYRACFARNLQEMRRYKNYELEVHLKDTRPAFQRQYRLSHSDALECHRQINEMAECEIISPSQNSKYQPAMFTVRKSNGRRRAVLDLRSVNSRVEEFLIKLPDMTDLLHSLAAERGKFYSCLDLTSFFLQLPLKKGLSQDITSFYDPLTGSKYKFNTCPFGLSNSPAAMVTVLSTVFSSLVSQGIVYLYMDDICLTSKDWSTHLQKLETVLEKLDINNLSCQPTKASLAFPSVKFLGFEISQDGLKITDDKIKILKSLKPPHDRKSLEKVFGIWNFLRQHVPLFTKSTFHMRQLLTKDAKFQWTREHQVEFDDMIKKPTSAPVLQALMSIRTISYSRIPVYLEMALPCFNHRKKTLNEN
jgi:hypothetical protein